MTDNAVHDRLVLELLKRKHAHPSTSVAVTALLTMRGQRWPLEELAKVLDVAIAYLDAQLGDSAPAVIDRMKNDLAFKELADVFDMSDATERPGTGPGTT